MVELDPLLGKFSFNIHEIHGQIISGLWMCAFTFSFSFAILAFFSVLLTRIVITGGTQSNNFLSAFIISYALTIVGGVVLFVPAIIAIHYFLSKSRQERKYVPALQDLIAWVVFLSLGGLGSILLTEYVAGIDRPFGSGPDFSPANVLITVGLVGVFASMGVALVLNFLLGITTLLSFVSEYYDKIFSLGLRLWKRVRRSRPILAVEAHLAYCKENNYTLFGGIVHRLRSKNP